MTKAIEFQWEGINAMTDHIIIWACVHIIGLWLLNTYGYHNFNYESIMTLLNGVVLIYVSEKEKKK